MSDLRDWLKGVRSRISGRSDLANAIRWDALTPILRDGRACIDNSEAERAMRPIAVGRRNWRFAGSDAGGERAAAIYSLIQTAKLHGLDPEAYLRHVLERIADYPVSRVGDLLLWNTTGIHPRLDQHCSLISRYDLGRTFTSITPAVGFGSRPAASRAATTSAWLIRGSVPSSAQR